MTLLPTIASGLAGWLTYEHMRRKVPHHEEPTLYGPITDIAEANGYRVKREFPLPSRSQNGRVSQKEIDFVMINGSGTVAVVLEVKFKKTAKAMAGSIGADARKIRDLDAPQLNKIITDKSVRLPKCKDGCKVHRAVLFVWREGDIVKAIREKEPKPIQRQFIELLKGMFNEPANINGRMLAEAMLTNTPIKPVNVKAGYLRWGSTYTAKRYWIAVLKKRTSWTEL